MPLDSFALQLFGPLPKCHVVWTECFHWFYQLYEFRYWTVEVGSVQQITVFQQQLAPFEHLLQAFFSPLCNVLLFVTRFIFVCDHILAVAAWSCILQQPIHHPLLKVHRFFWPVDWDLGYKLGHLTSLLPPNFLLFNAVECVFAHLLKSITHRT